MNNKYIAIAKDSMKERHQCYWNELYSNICTVPHTNTHIIIIILCLRLSNRMLVVFLIPYYIIIISNHLIHSSSSFLWLLLKYFIHTGYRSYRSRVDRDVMFVWPGVEKRNMKPNIKTWTVWPELYVYQGYKWKVRLYESSLASHYFSP